MNRAKGHVLFTAVFTAKQRRTRGFENWFKPISPSNWMKCSYCPLVHVVRISQSEGGIERFSVPYAPYWFVVKFINNRDDSENILQVRQLNIAKLWMRWAWNILLVYSRRSSCTNINYHDHLKGLNSNILDRVYTNNAKFTLRKPCNWEVGSLPCKHQNMK